MQAGPTMAALLLAALLLSQERAAGLQHWQHPSLLMHMQGPAALGSDQRSGHPRPPCRGHQTAAGAAAFVCFGLVVAAAAAAADDLVCV